MLTAEKRAEPRNRCAKQQRGSYRETSNDGALSCPLYGEAGRWDRLLDPSLSVSWRQPRPTSDQRGKILTIILFDAGAASGGQ